LPLPLVLVFLLLCSSSRANPLYSVFLLLEQQQEKGMALLVFLLLLQSSPWFSPAPQQQQENGKPKAKGSSSRANPLGMALLVFPCSAAGKTKGQRQQ
jgi:hypothetical protein